MDFQLFRCIMGILWCYTTKHIFPYGQVPSKIWYTFWFTGLVLNGFFNMFATIVTIKTKQKLLIVKKFEPIKGCFWNKKDHITSKAMKSLAWESFFSFVPFCLRSLEAFWKMCNDIAWQFLPPRFNWYRSRETKNRK